MFGAPPSTLRRGSPRRVAAPLLLLAALAALALATLLVACGPEEQGRAEGDQPKEPREAPSGVAEGIPERPNLILVLADDLDEAVYERSTLDSAWAPEGASFEDALVTTSLCCPSRASILRGQYAHNTGLWNNDNSEPGGGAKFFRESGLEGETLATMLKGEGYETWYGGKYLNGYGAPGFAHIPPGWDHWRAYLSHGINVDGRTVPYDEHYTDWLAGEAAAFIEGREDREKPFFMHVAALDTHEPYRAPPRHAGRYPDARAPRPPSFGEEDLSDKPSWVREGRGAGRPVSARKAAAFDRTQAARMRSALTLEDLSRDLVGALKRAGELDETYLLFLSDNGFQQGLHGVRAAKSVPYMEAHEVPFVVRGPGVPAGASFDGLAANIDVAPTLLDLAGAKTPEWMDGRSLVPFLDGEAPASEEWRRSLLIEGAQSREPGRAAYRPAYSGVVRREEGGTSEVYVRYEDGEEEYYDLEEDPYQLESRPGEAPREAREALDALRGCSGDGCREAEGP